VDPGVGVGSAIGVGAGLDAHGLDEAHGCVEQGAEGHAGEGLDGDDDDVAVNVEDDEAGLLVGDLHELPALADGNGPDEHERSRALGVRRNADVELHAREAVHLDGSRRGGVEEGVAGDDLGQPFHAGLHHRHGGGVAGVEERFSVEAGHRHHRPGRVGPLEREDGAAAGRAHQPAVLDAEVDRGPDHAADVATRLELRAEDVGQGLGTGLLGQRA
jgi:hypothetical protein